METRTATGCNCRNQLAGFILKVFFGGEPAQRCSLLSVRGPTIPSNLLEFEHAGHIRMWIVQIMMGVTLAIGVILFSKLFCGSLLPPGYGNGMDGRVTQKDENKHQHHHGFSC